MNISNCSIEVNPGPSKQHLDVVQNLQDLCMKQLEMLQEAHRNLKPSDANFTGIHVENVNEASKPNPLSYGGLGQVDRSHLLDDH